MSIVISSGHGKLIRGASGYLDEVDEARKVVEKVASYLRSMNVDVTTFHDDTSTSQDENLHTIVDFHNRQERELDISVHFNAYETTSDPMGTEVLYTSQFELADKLSDAISDAGDFIDRGPKQRTDLYFLNKTEMPAVLIETCFVDSLEDAELYGKSFDVLCEAIAEVVSGGSLPEEAVEPEIPETLPEYTGQNRVDITGSVRGDVMVAINGQPVHGVIRSNAVVMDIKIHGDVVVTINGQDFHNKEQPIPSNQTNITATVFGGGSDPNYSAYPPYDGAGNGVLLNDTDMYIALPDRIEGERPTVRVYNRDSGQFADASIEDVGPWNTNDPYWATGTRPQAESGIDMDGDKTNGAGIDLSPALAKALSIDGKGTVDWEFHG